MSRKKTYIFLGTMAEVIKLAPVLQELQRRKIEFTIIASGQTDIHFDEFKIFFKSPKVVYAITPKNKESSIAKFSIWAMRALFSSLIGLRPRFRGLNKTNSYFIVHGDTVSSLIGALVAHFYGLKIVHIESGLRSFNFIEPFPEEICRYIVSRLSDIHFCPNQWSVNNLKNVQGKKISTHQNTLIESFDIALHNKSKSIFVKSIQKKHSKFFVLVVHRQEHVLFNKNRTRNELIYLLQHIPENISCIFVVHDLSSMFINSLNNSLPRKTLRNIVLLKRLPYHEFMQLLQKAEFLITDGGSNQEEMYYMGKPCLLLRNFTERIEGLGDNVLLSKNNRSTIDYFVKHYKAFQRYPVSIQEKPSKIIADFLFSYEKR